MKLLTHLTTAALLTLPTLTLSTCPNPYPFTVNTTTPSAVFLRIFSYDTLNGRALQLRTQPDGRQIVVIDATSPVLWAEFRKGILYTQAKTDENQRYSLGPASYLKSVSTKAYGTLSEFGFRNATKTNPATGGFVLEIPTQDAVYALYHDTPDNTANGWMACQKSGYQQLFYYAYTSDPPSGIKGCTFLGVETTLAPYVAN